MGTRPRRGAPDTVPVEERAADRSPADTAPPDPSRRESLGTLYARHGPDAVRLATLLTGDPALGQDLVQEAFVRLGGRLVHLRRPEAFEAYLRRTVVNLARMHFRRRRVERAWLARQPAPERAAPPDLAEERDELRTALHGLPERQRAALVLRFYEDLTHDQIAQALGCRPGTAASLVSRGLTRLRQELGEPSKEDPT